MGIRTDKQISSNPFKARDILCHVVSILLATVLLMNVPCVFAADLGLIEPQALARDQAAWVVLDARSAADWRAGHIPGARSFSWEDHTGTDEKGVRYKIRPPQELASALGALGIDEKTPVVVYGDADKDWGGEGWNVWVMTLLGHKGPVRLLDGGIRAWRAAGLPLKTGDEKYTGKPAGYRLTLRQRADISTTELRTLMGSVAIVDTRSNWEWFRRSIPTAVHIPWDKFHTGRENRPIAQAELKKLLSRHGIDPMKPVVYYCSGGIRSAYAWMVHELSGLPPARNYEGGMEEWKRAGPR